MEGDIVYVAPTLSLAGGLEAREDIRSALGSGSMLKELWLVTFVKHGALGWNFLDEDGDPIPFDVDDLLADMSLSEVVAEKCDELYGEAVTRPLLENIKKLSQRGRKGGLMSPTGGATTRQERSSSRTPKPRPTQPGPSLPRSSAGVR